MAEQIAEKTFGQTAEGFSISGNNRKLTIVRLQDGRQILIDSKGLVALALDELGATLVDVEQESTEALIE